MQVPKQALSGVLFMAIGFGAAAIASNYRIGTATHMGPGYFPVAVGLLVAVLGIVLIVRALVFRRHEDCIALTLPSLQSMRPLIFVFSSVAAFAALVSSAGLVIGIFALVLIGRLADSEGNWRETLLMMIVLPAIAIAIFVIGLQMPLKVGPM